MYPKGFVEDGITKLIPDKYELKWNVFRDEGSDAVILAAGSRMIDLALQTKGATVVNCSCVKPLDYDCIKRLIKNESKVITLEDGIIHGGFGEAVRTALDDLGLKAGLTIIGFGDELRRELSGSASFRAAGITIDRLNGIINGK